MKVWRSYTKYIRNLHEIQKYLKSKFDNSKKQKLFESLRDFSYQQGEKSMMKYKARQFFENKARVVYLTRLRDYVSYRQIKAGRSNEIRKVYNLKLQKQVLTSLKTMCAKLASLK